MSRLSGMYEPLGADAVGEENLRAVGQYNEVDGERALDMAGAKVKGVTS